MAGASGIAVPDREAILAFLAANDLGYQRVELPYGLATPGPDRSGTAAVVFPEDLRGQSVLDVGCYLGYFCHEAKRRNAGRVVGLDVDEERLAQAHQLARFAGHAIEFRHFDLERDDLDERFDVVLLLNVLHHARHPTAMLSKLARYARRRLVLEVPSVTDGRMKHYLKRTYGLRRRHVSWLERLPVIAVGRNGALDQHREQSFFFSPVALEHVLLQHGRGFTRLDVHPSPMGGRFVAVAHRRQVGSLAVVAGPSGVGKSRFCTRLLDRTDPGLWTRLGLEPDGWQVVSALELPIVDAPRVERMLFHYDLLRPRKGGARTYGRDEALDLVDCAETAVAYALHCPRDELIRRLESRLAKGEEEGAGRDQAQLALALYRRPGALRRLYEEWIAFCEERRVALRFVDASRDDYAVSGPDGLGAILSRLG